MAEIKNFEKVLEMIGSYSRFERVLLATAGTLQSVLSVYFLTPVRVDVVSQAELDDGTFTRDVHLVRCDNDEILCRTNATISVEREDVRALLLSKEQGIGRILLMLDVRTTFELQDVGNGSESFWRLYRLEGNGVSFLIREEFPKAVFAVQG